MLFVVAAVGRVRRDRLLLVPMLSLVHEAPLEVHGEVLRREGARLNIRKRSAFLLDVVEDGSTMIVVALEHI